MTTVSGRKEISVRKEEVSLFIVKGKYNEAKIFADWIDDNALKQIKELCNQEFVKGSRIRIMPDAHAGVGCTVGTTMTITDKIVPNLVGVDIGCGMEVTFIKKDKSEIDFDRLDRVIRKYIPSGFAIRSTPHEYVRHVNLDAIKAPYDRDRAEKSIGTLGGGNHFIELNEVEPGMVALVIHSGSRHLGKQIAEYYQDLAYISLLDMKEKRERIIAELKAGGREKEIREVLQKMKTPDVPKDLAYLEGETFKAYMHDMKIAQRFAFFNRKAMTDVILEHMGWTAHRSFTTIHNYIDMEHMILRKGAISVQKGEEVIIPMNMRDGSIIAVGKGNPDWNYSGPHGAGRIMSRAQARKTIKLNEFQKSMKGIYTTSINKRTLDEAPMAYKPMDEIIRHTKDTIEIKQIIKPIYNFKAN